MIQFLSSNVFFVTITSAISFIFLLKFKKRCFIVYIIIKTAALQAQIKPFTVQFSSLLFSSLPGSIVTQSLKKRTSSGSFCIWCFYVQSNYLIICLVISRHDSKFLYSLSISVSVFCLNFQILRTKQSIFVIVGMKHLAFSKWHSRP